jgi:hypothetical protein
MRPEGLGWRRGHYASRLNGVPTKHTARAGRAGEKRWPPVTAHLGDIVPAHLCPLSRGTERSLHQPSRHRHPRARWCQLLALRGLRASSRPQRN